jgi:hypothetical protein
MLVSVSTDLPQDNRRGEVDVGLLRKIQHRILVSDKRSWEEASPEARRKMLSPKEWLQNRADEGFFEAADVLAFCYFLERKYVEAHKAWMQAKTLALTDEERNSVAKALDDCEQQAIAPWIPFVW